MDSNVAVSISAALEAALFRFTGGSIDAALILGSGLGSFADSLTVERSISTADLPDYPVSTVVGHEGRLLLARMNGKRLLLFQGRIHGYEGYSGPETSLPARIAALLHAKTLMLTNAAGGLHPAFAAGDLMLITDILIMPSAPLMGRNLHEHTLALTALPRPIFSPAMLDLVRNAAIENKIRLREGTYGYCSGPTYETRSEIGFFRQAGADAAGMSTVPEITFAVRAGMQIIAISCITNKALTVPQPVSHEEVTAVAAKVSATFARLILAILSRL